MKRLMKGMRYLSSMFYLDLILPVFFRTKKYVVDMLLCGCPGNNITELLEHRTSEREEQAHQFLQANDPEKLYFNNFKIYLIHFLVQIYWQRNDKYGRT